MFGHDDKNQQEEHVTGDGGEVVQPMSTTPPDENVVGVPPTDDTPSAPPAPEPTTAPTATVDDDDDDINKIVDDINSADDTDEAEDAVEHEQHAEATHETAPAAETTPQETPGDLQEVKKSALQELSPLLDELDQPDEEKLDILMMTIQATDDQSLIPQAFATAKRIQDKKARAEAMLDIIQEINYFTKKQ